MKTFDNFSDTFPKVTIALPFLESFRILGGKKLPPSYIDFANTCGYGRLCDMFIMYVPMEIDYPDSLQEQIDYLQGAPEDQFTGFDARDAICLITPDRFANGDPTNDVVAGLQEGTVDRTQGGTRHGGDLKGITDHLDYLDDLDFTAV